MKDDKKGIGLHIDKNIYEMVNYITKNVEYTSRSSYLKKLILNDIKKRIENGDNTLKEMYKTVDQRI